jgi:deoxyribodipyrimidine photo-lyase
MIRSILWFRQDLRLHDNEALHEALRNCEELIPVYILDPQQFSSQTQYGTPKTGAARTRFLLESLNDLRNNLRSMGSELVIRTGDQVQILFDLAAKHKVNYIYCNRERTREEVDVQDQLEKRLWTIGCEIRYSRGKMLYYTSDLPFPVTHCPDSFVVFKKEMDQHIPVRMPLATPATLVSFPSEIEGGTIPELYDLCPSSVVPIHHYFKGGETAAFEAVNKVEEPKLANLMAGGGTLLSPWIAMGCLSPKKVYYDSLSFSMGTEVLQQHLLYRDYLRLMGKKYGDRIFAEYGLKEGGTPSRKDPKALQAWQQGRSGIAIVDAAMHQLNQTGWLPDNLRRLVARYFIKVLKLDWRLGAAYFEARLIDYDPCTNWISWLNLAGLGPDSREDRTINYEAVGKRLDPEGTYISAWHS